MNCYGCASAMPRGFLTKEEKLELLKEYKENLDKEAKGVAERIEEIKEE